MDKISAQVDDTLPEIAFYYPGPVWRSGDWIKNLILFFDGVGLLVPDYIKDKPFLADPAIAEGLDEHGLLHILEPEKMVDKDATNQLATVMTDIIVSGTLDSLAKEETDFHELSFSRLGSYGDPGLAQMIFEELKARGLARDSKDSFSIPMHPMVRSLVLVLLAQILRSQGRADGLDLLPATDRPEMLGALKELLAAGKVRLPDDEPSKGDVVAFDLELVGVDLSDIPMDEVLGFRKDYRDDHQRYARSVRRFVRELSAMTEEERAVSFDDREAEIRDLAAKLRDTSKKAWRKPAAFALGLGGAVVSAATGNLIGAFFSAAAAVVGYQSIAKVDTEAYSYLFNLPR
jgi:hypothetical protein